MEGWHCCRCSPRTPTLGVMVENYTANFKHGMRCIELNVRDTSGASYYDNVRRVILCSSALTVASQKHWIVQRETQEFCPNAKVVPRL